MNVKKYRAPTLALAMAAVKAEYGRRAVILGTRKVRVDAFLGVFGGHHEYEVTAAPSPDALAPSAQGTYVAETPAEQAPAQAAAANSVALPDSAAAPHEDPVSRLCRMIEHYFQGAAPVVRGVRQRTPPQLREFEQHLRRHEVEDALTDEIIRELRLNLTGRQLDERAAVRQRLKELIITRLPIAGAITKSRSTDRGRVIMLIGPTGVGKTTTIAKLAANFKLRQEMRVGLITIDTYRIAAVEQLRIYAGIIDVPVRVVLTEEDLRQAIYAMRGMDVILIDTAGRSQNDDMRLRELRPFVETARANEVHLVVSASAGRGVVRRTLRTFGQLGVNRVILSKLDEAETFGTILNVGARGIGEFSYVTTGQEVPDDLAAADAQQLAEWLLGGRFHGD